MLITDEIVSFVSLNLAHKFINKTGECIDTNGFSRGRGRTHLNMHVTFDLQL